MWGTESGEAPTDLPRGAQAIPISEAEGEMLIRSPQLMAQASVDVKKNVLKFPTTLIAQEKQSVEDKGKMRRITDLNSADVVFDGSSCFLQAAVENTKLSIVDEAGVPVMTFQVDSPFPIQFPEGAELYCLSNNVTTYYVIGWV